MLPNNVNIRGGLCASTKPKHAKQAKENAHPLDAVFFQKGIYCRGMVPPIGFELMTYRLQGGCSTN
jgi:hypothetical protein